MSFLLLGCQALGFPDQINEMPGPEHGAASRGCGVVARNDRGRAVSNGRPELAHAVYDAVADAVAAEAALDHVIVFFISPRRDVVEAMLAERTQRGEDPERWRLVWDFEAAGALAGAEALGLRDVTTGLTPLRTESEFLDEVEALVAARKAKLLDHVVVWTIDAPMQLGVLLYKGVDGIMTNESGEFFDLWQLTL